MTSNKSGSARGVVVYQYTRKRFAKIPKINGSIVYCIPGIQRKWYTEYPYLSCNIPYTRFKKPLYTVYSKTLTDPDKWHVLHPPVMLHLAKKFLRHREYVTMGASSNMTLTVLRGGLNSPFKAQERTLCFRYRWLSFCPWPCSLGRDRHGMGLSLNHSMSNMHSVLHWNPLSYLLLLLYCSCYF